MYNTFSPLKHTFRLFLMAGACMLLSSVATHAAIIYVNSSASGANNGNSWINAYTSLQSALAASSAGDEIWVAGGTYKPSVPVDFDGNGMLDAREATFIIKTGVKVYGGFAGGEASLMDRNWLTNITILSGDIDNNDVNLDGNQIAENTDQLVGNNALHVVYTANVTNATLVDGFVITSGKAYAVGLPNNSPNMSGGGWFNKPSAPANASNPVIANCIFQGNYAGTDGAAWYSLPGVTGASSEPTFTACKFYNNRANFSGGAIFLGSFDVGTYSLTVTDSEFSGNRALRYGGAIYLYGDASTMVNCTFTDNAVTVISPDGGTLPGSGGAVNLTGSTMTRFKECIFTGNKATGTPNGVWEGGGGGAVYMSSFEGVTNKFGPADIAFENCGFYNNTASDNTSAWGGATQHKSDTGKMKASYVNCVFSGNYAQTEGGAVGNYYRVLAEPAFVPGLETNFTNCTFSNNSAGSKGGGLNYNKATGEPMALSSRIENSILFGNTAPIGSQIGITGFSGPVLAFNLIEGGYNATLGENGGNNLAGDPMFINAADPDGADNIPGTSDDGLRVSTGSPAINSGNNSAIGLMGITTDFAGAARVQGGSVDMGAYESSTIYIPPLPIKYYWLREWRKPKPGCLSCPWAIRFVDKSIIYNPNKPNFGLIQNFIWKSKPQLIIYADSAIVTGRIASQQSPSIQFDVYLKLVEQNDWQGWAANNRTYSAHTPEAKQVADHNFQNWTYWVLSNESRLVGRASISGTLMLEHSPENMSTGFQLGLGANDQDGDFGLNGEFTYSGVLSYKKLKLQVKGNGSLNADAELCETDCSQEEETKSIAREDFSGNSTLEAEEKGFQIFRVYPNPVHDKLTVELTTLNQGTYRLQLYNMRGQLVYQSEKQISQGSFAIETRHLAVGIYRLEIISPEGKIQNEKIIHY